MTIILIVKVKIIMITIMIFFFHSLKMVTNSLARYYKKTKKERKKLWKKTYEMYQNLSQKEKKGKN